MDLSNTEVVVHYPNFLENDYNARDLIKFTGAYKYDPVTKESHLNEVPYNIEHKGINWVRGSFKKSPYKANSNQLYRKVHKTLNLVNRMYDSVYNQYSKQYPEIKKGKMPKIRVQILDKCFEEIKKSRTNYKGDWGYYITTSNAYGNAYRNSTKINLQAKALNEFSPERVENLIMHELGHAVFGLSHCRKRKKKCPIMSRYSYQRGDITHSSNRRTFRKFIKNKYYKSQIKRLKEVR
jgi:predicted Zn-dependent protease